MKIATVEYAPAGRCAYKARERLQSPARWAATVIVKNTTDRIPTTDGPTWGVIDGPGLGITVNEAKLLRVHEVYHESGQYLPYDLASEIGRLS